MSKMGTWRSYCGPLRPALLLLALCGVIHLRHGPYRDGWIKWATLTYNIACTIINAVTAVILTVTVIQHGNVLASVGLLHALISLVYTAVLFWFSWSEDGLHHFLNTLSTISLKHHPGKVCTTRTKINVITGLVAIVATIHQLVVCISSNIRLEEYSDRILPFIPQWIRYKFGYVFFVALLIPNATRIGGPLMFSSIAMVIQDEFKKLKERLGLQIHHIQQEERPLAPDTVKCVMTPCVEARLEGVVTACKAQYERLADVIITVDRFASILLGLSTVLHTAVICCILKMSLFPGFKAAYFFSGVYDASYLLFLCLPPAFLGAMARSLQTEMHKIPLSDVTDRALQKVNYFLIRLQGSTPSFSMLGIFTIDKTAILTILITITAYVAVTFHISSSSISSPYYQSFLQPSTGNDTLV